MDSLVLIERLDELMAEAKPIPFTREARVERDEVYKILDRLRTTLPVEFERVRWMGRESEQDDGVETRLKEITSALAELRQAQQAQAQRPSAPPLTVAAAGQVREVIEAAERTAAAVERDANAEAQRLRTEAEAHLGRAKEEADRHLRETRERAAEEAAAYLSRVEEATKKMLERANSAGTEINGMLASLRGSGGSVIEDLEAIMAGLTEIEVRRTEAAAPAKAPAAPKRAEAVTPGATATIVASPAPESRRPARSPARPATPAPPAAPGAMTARMPSPRTAPVPADSAPRSQGPGSKALPPPRRERAPAPLAPPAVGAYRSWSVSTASGPRHGRRLRRREPRARPSWPSRRVGATDGRASSWPPAGRAPSAAAFPWRDDITELAMARCSIRDAEVVEPLPGARAGRTGRRLPDRTADRVRARDRDRVATSSRARSAARG